MMISYSLSRRLGLLEYVHDNFHHNYTLTPLCLLNCFCDLLNPWPCPPNSIKAWLLSKSLPYYHCVGRNGHSSRSLKAGNLLFWHLQSSRSFNHDRVTWLLLMPHHYINPTMPLTPFRFAPACSACCVCTGCSRQLLWQYELLLHHSSSQSM